MISEHLNKDKMRMHYEAISQWCSKLILDVPWQTVKNQSITPLATQG